MHYFIVVLIAFALSMYGCEGKTGPAGPTGAAGAAGPAGPAGPQGSTGPSGPAGPQGPAGADGADGAAGPQGEKGDTGEAGPAGPQGEKGDTGEQGPAGAGADPGAIQDIIDGVVDTGILADVHHILLLKDGETDPKKGTAVMGPDFDDEIAVGVLVGSSTTYAAKAASANGDPIPVTFSWMSEDDEIASVDAGTITGNEKGMTDVTLSVDGRGIEVTFKVTVHDVVKSIIASTGDPTTIAVGDEIEVNAAAYDAAQDDKKSGAEGNPVPDITFTWMSSKTDVATVDEDGMVTAVGVGSTDITAHVGDITSNKVKVTVFDVQTVERRLRVTNLPIAGTYVGVGDSLIVSGGDNTVLTGNDDIAGSVGAINVAVEQFDPTSGDSGAWAAVGQDAAMVKYVSLDTDVITFAATTSNDDDMPYMGEATISTDGSGNANMPAFTHSNDANGKVVGRGTARVEISTQYATTLYIEVTVTLPATHKAPE